MFGYNLYLIDPPDENGYAAGPLFLALSYASFIEAEAAKELLERVYGKGRIEISVRGPEQSLAE